MEKIAILGAGLIGRTLALLLKDQFAVHLFEKTSLNDSNSTGRLAAAMVAPTAESVNASDHLVQLGQLSTQLWPELLARLKLPNLYQNKGTLVLAHRQDVNDLQHFKQRLSESSQSRLEPLSRFDVTRLEPDLNNQFAAGLLIDKEGQIDNENYYKLTETMIRQSNIVLQEHTSVDISEVEQDFNLVIDCRGLGSKTDLADKNANLRGVRGEVVRVKAPEVELTRPIRVMHPRHPIYIAPKPNNEYVIGATEIESEDNKSATVRSTLELLSAAYSVHKGFAEAEVLSIKVGLRPTLLDNEPSIIIQGNLIQVNGLYRHGYLIAPSVLQQLLLLISPDLSFSEALLELNHQLVRRL